MNFPDENPTKETLDSWHKDPNNWKLGMFYYNPKDKRIFPPKRLKWTGWTVNFANPLSIFAMIALFFVILLLAFSTKEWFK